MTTILQARNVTKVFGDELFSRSRTVALEDFSLSIDDDPPTITTIAGESGSGKTTLAQLLLGFLTPTEGEVLYKGKDLRRMARGERRTFRREVQAVFQDPFEVYNPFYKVDHILTTPVAKYHLADSQEETRELIRQALTTVGLRPEETLGRYPHQLSGGQRQRITVARALLLKPSVLIADEPVSMIDASLRATILESLSLLNREVGIPIMYITHDLTTAYQITDNIVVLYQGSVTEAGDVDLIIKTPQHPYTRMLIGSIPFPDPDSTWGGQELSARVSEASDRTHPGCKYADRCPLVMPICRDSPPPLFRTDEHRAVACYLLRESGAVLEGADVAKVFTTRAKTPKVDGGGASHSQ